MWKWLLGPILGLSAIHGSMPTFSFRGIAHQHRWNRCLLTSQRHLPSPADNSTHITVGAVSRMARPLAKLVTTIMAP